MPVVNEIIKHSISNVLDINVLRDVNYPLYRYCRNNEEGVARELKSNGVYLVLESTPMDLEKAEAVLRMTYGGTVNTTDLRVSNRALYEYLTSRPNGIKGTLGDMGLGIIYESEQRLLDGLREISMGGILSRMDKGQYGKVSHRAHARGVSIEKYLDDNGITYIHNYDRDAMIITKLAKGEKIKEVARRAGVSESTVFRVRRANE